MKRFILIAALAAFSVVSLVSVSYAQEKAVPEKMKKMGTTEMGMMRTNLRLDMRKLWEDHITYTRNYIISALAGLGDADAVAQRLLKNQDDIGDAIKPFYGEEAGKKLAVLLRDHIMIAAEVVKAAKAGQRRGGQGPGEVDRECG